MRTTAELRDAILTAARVEFAQYGLAGARIDRIAKNSNASKDRLYVHFGDKESLFREIVVTDGAEFLLAVGLRPDAVAEFAGDIFDLAQNQPEHLRMITWAHLEGFWIVGPELDGDSPPHQAIAALRQAQAEGHVDSAWDPHELLVFLFGIGLAWARWPDPTTTTTDPEALAHRRAAVVEAATRIIKPI